MNLGRHSRLNSILVRLHSQDFDEQDKAVEDLQAIKKGWMLEEGYTILEEAAKSFPPRRYSFEDTSTNLVAAICEEPKREYIPIILENFTRYSQNARWWALRLLSRIPDGQGYLSLLRLIQDHADRGLITGLPVDLTQRPEESKVLFPEILKFSNTPIGISIYEICLACCEARFLSPEILEPHTADLINAYGVRKEKLVPRQKSEGLDWMWADDYVECRCDAALLLDLMGYFPGQQVEAELIDALQYFDPRLKFFAVISLLKKQKTVPQSHFEQIAASAETRNWLYQRLNELGRQDLFPGQFRNQQAFAESDMVGWLIFPTELARVPDEIELMKIVSIDTPRNGSLDYYVFRFRTYPPHWAADDGWIAGVSGPFLRKDAPSTIAHGDTFSSFNAWDSMTPDQHVGDVKELLARWSDYNFGNREK